MSCFSSGYYDLRKIFENKYGIQSSAKSENPQSVVQDACLLGGGLCCCSHARVAGDLPAFFMVGVAGVLSVLV